MLRGSVLNLFSATTTFDSATGRAAGVEINVHLQLTLIERATGKTLYSNPSMAVRERYEISTDPRQYLDESQAALQRLSRDVARTVISAILENF